MEIVKDCAFTIRPKEGVATKNSHGMTDNRLWKGGNRLHALLDGQSLLWSLKYEVGALPEEWKGKKWTKFDYVLADVVKYFDKRGLTAEYNINDQSTNSNIDRL